MEKKSHIKELDLGFELKAKSWATRQG